VTRPRQARLAAEGGVFYLARRSDTVVTTTRAIEAKHAETAASTGVLDRLADDELAGA